MKVIVSTPRPRPESPSPSVALGQRMDAIAEYLECGGVASALFPDLHGDVDGHQRPLRPDRSLGRAFVLLLLVLAALFAAFVVWLCLFTRAIIRDAEEAEEALRRQREARATPFAYF